MIRHRCTICRGMHTPAEAFECQKRHRCPQCNSIVRRYYADNLLGSNCAHCGTVIYKAKAVAS
jgi:hypothetical protein